MDNLVETVTSTVERKYRLRADLKDYRDWHYAAPGKTLAMLPPAIDLRPHCPPVLDQSALGACTSHAIASAHRFDQMKEKALHIIAPSRLFIYYNERDMEGTTDYDAGAMIRDGMKSLAKQGVCPETEWLYDIKKFTVKPPVTCYTDALKHQSLSYLRVTITDPQMKGCLASGYPFVIGITVYSSFESAQVTKTGIVPMPAHGEKQLGGHAILVVGYDDTHQRYICMNSWGTHWGMQGFFTIPYSYFTSHGSDAWTLRTVEV